MALDAGVGEVGSGEVGVTECCAARHAEALELMHRGLDLLFEAGFQPDGDREARAMIEAVERVGRRVDAARVRVLDGVDHSLVFSNDGHSSAKVMVRHVAALSNAEAARRAKAARAMRRLPESAVRWRRGELGTCQVQRLAKTLANRRVAAPLVDAEADVLEWAAGLPFNEFDQVLGEWERFVDADGARDRNQRQHESRQASIIADYDGGYTLAASCGGLAGAAMAEVLRHFTEAEFRTDWEQAKADHGDATTVDHLSRTEGQRRFDALFEIFQRAVSTPPGESGVQVTLDVVMDQATFERELRLLDRTPIGQRPARDFAGFRCDTIDGAPLEPTEVLASGLVDHVRRAVIGANGVTIDLGRRSRLFTGPAAVAARLAAATCFWPGCWVPVSDCQIDHLRPFCDGGDTNQANAGPLCGRHNRHKHRHRYRTWRSPDGEWIIEHPDGTRLPGASRAPDIAGPQTAGNETTSPVDSAAVHDPKGLTAGSPNDRFEGFEIDPAGATVPCRDPDLDLGVPRA